MLNSYVNGQASIILRCKLRNSSVTTGAGLTGLTFSSSSLRIGTICDNEATSTSYTAAGSTIETVTTLGTYAAPTATKCRFKEVDATNHPGLYELQLADTRFAVASAKEITISFSGATNLAETDIKIPLRAVNPYDTVRGGMTALPNAAANANGGLPILSSSATTLAYTISTLTTYTGNTVQTGDAYARIGAAGAGLTALGDTRIAHLDANVSSIAGGTLAASDVWSYSGGRTITGGTIGTYTGNTPQTGDAYARIGAAGAGITALGDTRIAHLDADISSISSSGTDPWSVSLPGGYSAGQAGYIIGSNLNATVASRSSHSATDVWSVTTRLLTAGTNIALAKGTGITGFNDITAASIWDLSTSGHTTSGTFGASTDPWSAALPGSYSSGQAGYILGNQSGFKLASDGLDAIAVETGVNFRQAMSPVLASAAGVLSGAGTSTITIKGGNVSTTRISATVDGTGNRTAITLTLPT